MSKHILTSFQEYLNENIDTAEVKKLKKQFKILDDGFSNGRYSNGTSEEWQAKVDEITEIRRKLFHLIGDIDNVKPKNKVKPKGLDKKYDRPYDVPKNVYRWIFDNETLLYSDASDAVRWSRIINTADDKRYRGDITIYRAVEKNDYDEIREGDWVTTDEKYAIEHNNRYFDGRGKIISMDVNGRDVLVSPTGNHEEAIYAPLKFSIEIKL